MGSEMCIRDRLDGANVEIRNLVGKDNFFIFGNNESEIRMLREQKYDPQNYLWDELEEIFTLIDKGFFSGGTKETFRPIIDNLAYYDPFFVLADLPDYLAVHEYVSKVWTDKKKWSKMSLVNIARSGFFSSDRSIQDYCDKIWKI